MRGLDGQGNPKPSAPRGHGDLHHVGVRPAAVPVAGVWWLDPAEARGLPGEGGVPGGGHPGTGGRRAAGRRERGQGEDQGARQARHRDDRGDRAQGSVRPATRGDARHPQAEDAARRDLRGAGAGEGLGGPAGRRWHAAAGAGGADGGAGRDLQRVRRADAEGVPGLGEGIDRGDRGWPERGSERRLREPGGLRGGWVDAAEGVGSAGDRGAAPDQEHGRGVRGDQRARGCAGPTDREREQHLRGHGVTRRGAGRDLPGVPDLPGRVEGDGRRGSSASRTTPGRWSIS